MKIPGLSFGNNGINYIDGNKPSRTTTEKRSGIVDSVKISGTVNQLKHPEQVLYTVDPDYPPRTEVVRAVSERIARGAYSNELLDSVAEKIADSFAIKDVVAEVAVDNMGKPAERAEKVELAHDQVIKGYYDNPEMMEEIADILITALGLSSFVRYGE